MGHNIDKLEVYNEALNLASECIATFEGKRPYELSNHIIKTSISMPSNIAEGAQRRSNEDFCRFLSYSVGSCAELICQITLAIRRKCGDHTKSLELKKRLKSLLKSIWALIHSLSKET
ncbi:MAG: four helix bundle protein [Flavobacteriia bacterium]|nr:four helix bundle protein [Flavobacteriia bacterium]